MLFNSYEFLLFFPIVLIVFFLIPDRFKKYWLLVCSYYFYMCWNVKYVALLFISTFITYLSGLLLDKYKDKVSVKKLIVAGSFVINLGILFFFKYFNFAGDMLGSLFDLVGITVTVPAIDVLLPVGISFYTFQALSYTVDVYRGDIYAERNFFTYALYVSFFPQLVAGPIERSKNLLKQLNVFRKFDANRFLDGFIIMLWGYFLKIVLADRIAIFVDTVYKDMDTYQGMYIIVATVLFAVQIYCDFGGYSTIAVGAARILGIDIMENFNAPYLSQTVGQFWRNWHISLTSWFKDYLYIPLGGSRKGKTRKYLNKMIVFLVSGLWHGADLSFVVWGGLNGLYQVIGEILQPIRDRLVRLFGVDRESVFHKALSMLITFIMVDFAWVFFRASSMYDAITAVKSMLRTSNFNVLIDGSLYGCGLGNVEFWFMIACIMVLLWADVMKKRGIVIRNIIENQDVIGKSVVVGLIGSFILIFGIWGASYSEASFIYFQF